MAQLDKEDLKQMNRSYFQSLSQERLVEVAENLQVPSDRVMGKATTPIQQIAPNLHQKIILIIQHQQQKNPLIPQNRNP